MNLHLIFLVVAIVLFVIAAIGVPAGRVNVVAAGLAFFAASFI